MVSTSSTTEKITIQNFFPAVLVPEPVEGTLHRGFDKLNHQQKFTTKHLSPTVAVPKTVVVPELVESTINGAFDKLNHPETPQAPPHLRRR